MKNQYQIRKLENNLIGKRFGNLTVISLLPQRKNRYRCWSCICDCGNKIKVTSNHLKECNTTTCGCGRWKRNSKSEYWKGFGEISLVYFNRVKRGASDRNFPFKITINQIWNLFLKQNRKCALSGIKLNFQTCESLRDGTASLDRIDNSKGYTIDNVQWIHKDINYMNKDFTQKQLFEYCKLICINKKLL